MGVGLGAPASARATSQGPSRLDGDRFGTLVAPAASAVRVDRGTLTFAVAGDLASARVTATYEMTNTGAASELEVAFLYARGDEEHRVAIAEESAAAAISVDGADVGFRVVRDGEVFEPELEAWLAANPAIEEALRDSAARGSRAMGLRLAQLVAAAGGQCIGIHDDGRCYDLPDWYDATHGGAAPEGERDGRVVRAAREAIPGVFEVLTWGGSTLGRAPGRGPRRMQWLRFHLDFAAGQTRTVTVRYTHRPDLDSAARVHPVHTYEYLLGPARSWAGFGPLEVSVDLPEQTRFASSSPFLGEGEHRRVLVSGPQDGELRFEVMTLRGLWFLEDRPYFWVLHLIAAVLVNVGLWRLVARSRAGLGRGAGRTLLHALGSGVLVMLATVGVLGVMMVVFPSPEPGNGIVYALVCMSLVLLSGLIGVGVSVGAASRVDE